MLEKPVRTTPFHVSNNFQLKSCLDGIPGIINLVSYYSYNMNFVALLSENSDKYRYTILFDSLIVENFDIPLFS